MVPDDFAEGIEMSTNAFDDEWADQAAAHYRSTHKRTLIFTQCYLKEEAQGRLLGVNLELVQRLNPDFDILLIDNASPIPPDPYLPDSMHWLRTGFALEDIDISTFQPAQINQPGTLLHFRESIGHFSHKFVDERDPAAAQDGPGRAIMTALRIAMNSGYDRFCFVEDDVLFARPLEEGFAKLTKTVGCLPRGKWGYLEWGVFWVSNLKKLDELKFIERYDWPNQKQGPGREGERVYEWLLGDNLQTLPFIGGRGEGFINETNLNAVFPKGVDWLTHCSHATFAELLRLHGHSDLANKL